MTRFTRPILAALDTSKIVGIRAGRDHRFIGVWPIVVEGRLFARSWTQTPGGWYRTFLEMPEGAVEIGNRRIAVRARPVRSERLKSALDLAYREKFTTPGALAYVRGFHRPARRHTTTEFVPMGGRHRSPSRGPNA